MEVTCCEGWTARNGFSLLVLLCWGVTLNEYLIVNLVDEDQFLKTPSPAWNGGSWNYWSRCDVVSEIYLTHFGERPACYIEDDLKTTQPCSELCLG